MRRNALGLGLFLLLVTSVSAAAPAKTETVSFKSGDETISGYLATPAAAGRHPALVVIHEWWGLNDWVKEEAEKFAALGYVALAVDLYRGRVASDPETAHELMRGMPQDRAARDLRAAFDYLASRSDVQPAKIGSVGWCMGGGLSLLLAENERRLAACAVNYGAMPTDKTIIEKIHAPVLGNFGGLDKGITPDAVHAFEAAMKSAGKSVDAKIYGDAGHAFENPNNKAGYRSDDATDAWARMVAFFGKTLKGE
ncbi:MAG: dienelactone hydrolase family protein [Acidobacteria bacterium]|nr:MAG: dienelactone hydrolase family protein [Acidobacteriota bacterium]